MKETRSLGPPWASRLSRCHEPFLPAPDPCCAVLDLHLRWLPCFRPGVPQSPWLGSQKGCSPSPAGGWGWYIQSFTVPRARPGRGLRGGMPQCLKNKLFASESDTLWRCIASSGLKYVFWIRFIQQTWWYMMSFATGFDSADVDSMSLVRRSLYCSSSIRTVWCLKGRHADCVLILNSLLCTLFGCLWSSPCMHHTHFFLLWRDPLTDESRRFGDGPSDSL